MINPLRLTAQSPGLCRHSVTLTGFADQPQSAQVLLRYSEEGRLLPAALQPTITRIGISPANPDNYRLSFAITTGGLPARTWLEIIVGGTLYAHGPLLVTT